MARSSAADLTHRRQPCSGEGRVIELDDTHMVALNDPQATAEALLSLV